MGSSASLPMTFDKTIEIFRRITVIMDKWRIDRLK